MSDSLIDADILRYIIEHQVKPGERLPTIPELSTELDVSVSAKSARNSRLPAR